jgi:ABC-type multidrug transport system permease subunit
MKRTVFTLSILFAVFVLLISSMRQSAAEQKQIARDYISQGLYDEAMQAYTQSQSHFSVLKATVRLFGEFNAFLAILGILFIITGLLIKKPQAILVKRVKFNRDFRR